MKARIRKSGEIRNFYPTIENIHEGYVDNDGKFYYPSELNFILSEPEEEVTIWGFITRDQDGVLSLFCNSDKPHVDEGDNYWSSYFGSEITLQKELFPSVTWESEPLECTITIKPKKK